MGVAGDIAHPKDAFHLRRIQFVPAQRPDVTPVPTGVDIIVLNGVLPEEQDLQMRPGPSSMSKKTKELFREQDVSLNWKTVQKPGAGLQNLGNTCFMNSVLQCLTHTPPLAEALLAGKQLGSNKSFDPLRLTQQQVINSLQNRHNNHSVAPTAHAKSLRQISKSFRLGRQEDAHEYLVALLDAMHESYISMCRPKPSPELSQTSMIYRIFAGQIRSQVKCTECGHESNTIDVFLDLSLEINKASTVQKALQRFTTSEYLDGPNKYICPKQKKKVRAAKCMTIDKAPAVLVVQLKRFEFSMFGHKINKKVDFETELDLAPFMSNRRGPSQAYSLYGVLVHSGHSVHSGHYFAFVKAPTGLWHQLDDNHVSQVSERMVLSQKAYILFYIRKPTNGHAVPAELAQHAQQLSKGLNGLQAAASHSKQPDAPAVFGPAQRPAPGLLAAKRLHDELLAPAAQARNTRQVNATNSTAPPAAETSTCTNTHPTRSTDQLPSLGGVSLRDHGASNQQTRRQAQAPAEEGQEGLKLAAKRKADLLGSGKRPSMMQKMSAAGIDATAAADPTTEQPPKRKKHSADPPAAAAASSAAAAAAATTVAADEDPAVGQSAEPTDDLAVGSTSRVHQSDHAEHAVPAVDAEGLERHVARGVGGSDRHAEGAPQNRLEGAAPLLPAASPSSAHDSPVRHGASTIRSPVRRPARNVLFPSPQNDWQGRSWNRLNLHNHLHRAHYTRHIVANALSQRSLSPPHSPPDQLHDTSGSLSRVRHLPAQGVAGGPSRDVTEGVLDTSARLASNAAASSAERPLPEQTYRHSLDSAPAESRHTGAEAVVGEPRVKRQLLINGMHRGGPSAYPLLVNGHPPTELSRSVGASQLASQAKAVGITPGTGATPPGGSAAPAVDHSPLAAGAAADSMRLSAPPENGRLGTQYQQQEVTAQINSSITQRAGPASVKAFLSGIRPDPAPWDDVDPALAKDRAALNRQQAPRERRGLDEYDTEYDKGKQKKVKSKRGGPDAWQQGTNIFCKTASRGRGRAGFTGRSTGRGGRGHHNRSGNRGRGHDRSVHRDRGGS